MKISSELIFKYARIGMDERIYTIQQKKRKCLIYINEKESGVKCSCDKTIEELKEVYKKLDEEEKDLIRIEVELEQGIEFEDWKIVKEI